MNILSAIISAPDEGALYWRVANIGRVLQENGHHVDQVHYCREWARERCSERPGQRIEICSPLDIWYRHLRLVGQKNYDVIYANAHLAASLSLVGKITGKPIIYDMHGDFLNELLQSRGNRLGPREVMVYLINLVLDRANTGLSDRILCVSPYMIEMLRDRGIPESKLIYVPNGVDLEQFRPADPMRATAMKKELGLEGKMVFGYIGGHHPYQGVEGLLEAGHAAAGDDGMAFLIVGSSHLRKTGNVLEIPAVPRDRVADYYSACDVLVLPRPYHVATHVAAPTKFAEYAAMGKPVLTTDVGFPARLVEKYRSGIVVPDNDHETLLEGIRQFRGMGDRDLASAGQRSRLLAEREFDWDRIGARLSHALMEI